MREVILRRVLLATTTLIGAALLAAAASAQTAGPKAPFKAILDGEANGNFGILSGTQNSGTNGGHQRDFGAVQNAWMRFFFEAKADNGLTYGWNVRILGTSSTITVNGFSNDREGIYFRHDAWGTLSIGDDSATGKNGFPTVKADWGPPTSSQSYLGPDGKLEGAFLKNTDTRAFTIFNSFIKLGSDDGFPSGRAMHIWYGTPTYAGFSANMDFTPDGRSRNEEQFVTDTNAASPAAGTVSQSLSETNFQNVFSINLQYRGTLGPVAVGTGIQYAHAQSKSAHGLAGGSEFSSQTFKDANSWETGVVLNYAGFQFGLQYNWYGDSAYPKHQTGGNAIIGGAIDTWGWSTGLEYFAGPWVVGGYYWTGRAPGTFQWAALGTAPTPGGAGAFEFNYYAVGLGYTVAPGLKLYTEAFYYDDTNTHVVSTAANSGRNLSGQIYIVGTSIAW
jgi:outer membrane protein OmpU